MPENMCVVCGFREPTTGAVCDKDRERIAEQLRDLPRKIAALHLQLVPGAGGRAERVSGTFSPLQPSACLDALSLLGPGNVAVTGAFHPHVRRWRTTHTVVVHGEEREIVQWHQELVRGPDGQPVMVPDDDQLGSLPPAEWLDSWVTAWRSQLGHRGLLQRSGRPLPDTSATSGQPRRHKLNQTLGLTGWVAPTQRPDDPLAEGWETRFGELPRSESVERHVTYLLTWLDEACDRDLGAADFAAELRALSAELVFALGEQPDQWYVGRCPVELRDRLTDEVATCLAAIWQDPHASVIECPRCHSTWGPKVRDLISLAQQIHERWPIDRRRRYHAEEIDNLVTPSCPGCAGPMRVAWREVTARGDDRRRWRPVDIACSAGCEQVMQLL